MPKNVRRTKKTKHDPEVNMAELEAVHSGSSLALRQAAKDFSLSRSTLVDKFSGKSVIEIMPKTLLTQDEENKLVDHLIKQASQGFHKSSNQVGLLAKEILERRNTKSRYKLKTPSTSWVRSFYLRHPILSKHCNLTLEKEQAMVTPSDILTWFTEFENHILSVDGNLILDPTRIYCADDSLFAFDVKTKTMVSRNKKTSIYNNASTHIKKQVTVLACMSASGHYLPPLTIYPKRDKPSKELLDGFPQALSQVSDNGWITGEIFYSWLKSCFIPSTENIVKPILLLVDGHSSHNLVMKTCELCESHGIILYCLHPQSSHLIQPLHQAFFSTIKQEWSEAKQGYKQDNNEVVSVKTLAGVLGPVWAKAATVSNATDSFKTAGIYPFDPEKVMSSDISSTLDCYREYVDFEGEFASSNVDDDVPMTDSQPGPSTSKMTTTDVANESLVPDIEIYIEDPSSPFHSSSETEHDQAMESSSEDNCPSTTFLSTSLAEDKDFFASRATLPSNRGHTSSASIPSCSNAASSHTIDRSRLLALRNLALFLYDEVGRNQFLAYFNKLCNPQTQVELDCSTRFIKFEQLAEPLINERVGDNLEEKVTLDLDDILKLLNFSNARKNSKKPVFPKLDLGEKFRSALIKKSRAKKAAERKRLQMKAEMEERKKKRKEMRELEVQKIQEERRASQLKREALQRERNKKSEMAKAFLKEVRRKKANRFKLKDLSLTFDKNNSK